MRSRIVRINTLRMNQSLERIIPYHAFSPLSEKIKFPKIEIAFLYVFLRINAYFCGQLWTIANELRINNILTERIDTLRKISNGYLYDSDTLCFFCFFGGNIFICHA